MSFGRAVAVGQGTAQVIFESSSVKLQTTVRVVMDDIFVDAPKEMLTNVPYPKRGYKFSVKLSDSYHSKAGCALGDYKGVPFDCSVEPTYLGYAVPWIDRDTGNFSCVFFPYSPELLIRSVPKLKDPRPIRSVSITASLREANQVSGRASARLIGGFSILERIGQETMKLNMSPDSNKTSITLVGNTDVQIHMERWSRIKVNPVSKEGFGIGSKVVYEVEVPVASSFSEKIIIELACNGQRAEIDVDYDDMYELPVPIQWFFLIIIVVLDIVLCIMTFPNLVPGPCWDWMRRRQIFPTSDK